MFLAVETAPLVVSGVGLVLAAGCVFVTYRSLPARVERTLLDLGGLCHELEAKVERFDARLTQEHVALEGIRDEILADLDRVEKRRRRAQAQETRAATRLGLDPGTLDSIADPAEKLRAARDRARQLGLVA